METPVFLVRARVRESLQRVVGVERDGVPRIEPFGSREWIETAVTAMPTEDSARQDVQAKWRRQGLSTVSAVTVLRVHKATGAQETVAETGVPATSADSSNLTWIEDAWRREVEAWNRAVLSAPIRAGRPEPVEVVPPQPPQDRVLFVKVKALRMGETTYVGKVFMGIAKVGETVVVEIGDSYPRICTGEVTAVADLDRRQGGTEPKARILGRLVP